MVYSQEAALWLAMLWGGPLARREGKQIIQQWLALGHTRLSELFADLQQAVATLGLTPAQSQRLAGCAARVPEMQAHLRRLTEHGVDLLTRPDIAFPETLAQRLPEAELPYYFYFAGELRLLSEPLVAIWGADQPTPEAEQLAAEAAQAVSGAGHYLVGGYARGVDRLALEHAQQGGQGNVLVLPLGMELFLPTLDRWQLPPEEGSRLVLSPFAPDAATSERLAAAREELVLALCDAVVLIAPERGPLDVSWGQKLAAWGVRCLVWSGTDAEMARAWIQQGAQVFDAAHDLRRKLAGAEQGGQGWPTDTELAVEPLEPFEDADQAIEALSRSGRVPEALAKRLRANEDFYQHDPDPWGSDEDERPPEEDEV